MVLQSEVDRWTFDLALAVESGAQALRQARMLRVEYGSGFFLVFQVFPDQL